MACKRCADAIWEAGRAIQEIKYCDADDLPPDEDWAAIAVKLIELSAHLRLRAQRQQ